MKKLIVIFILILCSQSAMSQDIFGTRSDKIEIFYVGKFIKGDSIILSDSSAHYTGDQGGTAVYNPYGINQTDIKYDGIGQNRVEFGQDVGGLGVGALPFWLRNSKGIYAFAMSNSPDCDCFVIGKKISLQMDIYVQTLNPVHPDDGFYNGCTFTVWLYWVTP